MEWGSRLKELESIYEQTGEMPLALKSRPFPDQFEQLYYNAYQLLSASRQWTMGGPAAIPLSEILSYFSLYGITEEDERDDYLAMIRHLDSAYLEYTSNKRSK